MPRDIYSFFSDRLLIRDKDYAPDLFDFYDPADKHDQVFNGKTFEGGFSSLLVNGIEKQFLAIVEVDWQTYLAINWRSSNKCATS